LLHWWVGEVEVRWCHCRSLCLEQRTVQRRACGACSRPFSDLLNTDCINLMPIFITSPCYLAVIIRAEPQHDASTGWSPSSCCLDEVSDYIMAIESVSYAKNRHVHSRCILTMGCIAESLQYDF